MLQSVGCKESDHKQSDNLATKQQLIQNSQINSVSMSQKKKSFPLSRENKQEGRRAGPGGT